MKSNEANAADAVPAVMTTAQSASIARVIAAAPITSITTHAYTGAVTLSGPHGTAAVIDPSGSIGYAQPGVALMLSL